MTRTRGCTCIRRSRDVNLRTHRYQRDGPYSDDYMTLRPDPGIDATGPRATRIGPEFHRYVQLTQPSSRRATHRARRAEPAIPETTGRFPQPSGWERGPASPLAALSVPQPAWSVNRCRQEGLGGNRMDVAPSGALGNARRGVARRVGGIVSGEPTGLQNHQSTHLTTTTAMT